jgi:hypothetical protein
MLTISEPKWILRYVAEPKRILRHVAPAAPSYLRAITEPRPSHPFLLSVGTLTTHVCLREKVTNDPMQSSRLIALSAKQTPLFKWTADSKHKSAMRNKTCKNEP